MREKKPASRAVVPYADIADITKKDSGSLMDNVNDTPKLVDLSDA